MKIAILISGDGSNLQAFIDACSSGALPADIVLVASNRPGVNGLRRAATAGIPTLVVDHTQYASREDFDAALLDALRPHKAELVILAGFMRILTPAFIAAFRGRLLNIHPSLLPKYPGLKTHQRALDAGDDWAGATVHFVTEELDGGPPVVFARVPIKPTDSAELLAQRVQVREHQIYPLAADWFIRGRLQLTTQGATLDGKQLPASGVNADDYLQA